MRKTYQTVLFTAIVGFTASTVIALIYDSIFELMFLPLVTTYVACFFTAVATVWSSNRYCPEELGATLLIVAISPFTLGFIVSKINPDFFFFFSFFGKYMCFGATISLLIAQFTLIILRKKDRLLPPPQYPDVCRNCGEGLPPGEAFCPNCYTLSHKVKETFIDFPSKKYLDYIPDTNGRYRYCPHCDADYRHPASVPFYINFPLGSPIQYCKKCGHYLLDSTFYEWSVISPVRKLAVCFCLSPYSFLALLNAVFMGLQMHSWLVFLFILVMAVILKLIWLKIALPDQISDSFQRLKRNPEYPQLLRYMGYGNMMDSKYIALLKTKREELL